jgi:hypothetical protein
VDTPARKCARAVAGWSIPGILVQPDRKLEIYIVEVATYASYQVTVNSIYDQPMPGCLRRRTSDPVLCDKE